MFSLSLLCGRPLLKGMWAWVCRGCLSLEGCLFQTTVFPWAVFFVTMVPIFICRVSQQCLWMKIAHLLEVRSGAIVILWCAAGWKHCHAGLVAMLQFVVVLCPLYLIFMHNVSKSETGEGAWAACSFNAWSSDVRRFPSHSTNLISKGNSSLFPWFSTGLVGGEYDLECRKGVTCRNGSFDFSTRRYALCQRDCIIHSIQRVCLVGLSPTAVLH